MARQWRRTRRACLGLYLSLVGLLLIPSAAAAQVVAQGAPGATPWPVSGTVTLELETSFYLYDYISTFINLRNQNKMLHHKMSLNFAPM